MDHLHRPYQPGSFLYLVAKGIFSVVHWSIEILKKEKDLAFLVYIYKYCWTFYYKNPVGFSHACLSVRGLGPCGSLSGFLLLANKWQQRLPSYCLPWHMFFGNFILFKNLDAQKNEISNMLKIFILKLIWPHFSYIIILFWKNHEWIIHTYGLE